MATSTKKAAKKTSAKRGAPLEAMVTRDEFHRDPVAAFRRIRAGGRLWITDAAGSKVAVITAPTERIVVPAL